jgi:hypothetical protein
MADVEMQLQRIAEKLRAVLARGRTPLMRQWYGSGELRLRPPLPLSKVEAFEVEHGIALPEGYRAFLTKIGNGGLGPHSGLCALEDWDEGPDEGCALSTPFPAPKNASGNIRLPEKYQYPGAITLCHQGCGNYSMLVVTGPASGRIFDMSLDFQEEAWFKQDASFLDWYERWLDSVLAGVHFNRNW